MVATPSRRARTTAVLAAGVLSLVPLAACGVNSDSVNCSGNTCSVTLSGDGAKAKVLGSTVAFAGTDNGQATVGVAGHDVSCTEGQSVDAGPLHLECTKVTDDSVELSATLG
jgi:hypothetical protein